MGIKEDLISEVKKIFKSKWEERDGDIVPGNEDLKLGNDAVRLNGTVLYADLSSSTKLVDNYKSWFAAEIYKTYLYSAAKIIRKMEGEITAFDGDRIMAVFIGNFKNTNAAKSSLHINYLINEIINPLIKEYYPKDNYEVKQTVGIDTSELFIARTGIRGNNDLVWVGRAANYAAKLTSLSPQYPSRITKEVYERLNDSVKFTNGQAMWEKAHWTDMNIDIYRSTWQWEP